MDFLKKLIGDLTAKYGLTNIAGTVTMALAGLTFVADRWLGCNIGAILANPDATLALTCQIPTWFPATWVPATLATAAGVVFLAKLFRPGTILRNFFGGTAVIVTEKQAAAMPTDAGVVTSDQVDATVGKAKK